MSQFSYYLVSLSNISKKKCLIISVLLLLEHILIELLCKNFYANNNKKVLEKNYHSSLVESNYLYIYEVWLVEKHVYFKSRNQKVSCTYFEFQVDTY